ncbi:protein of unknown function DUF214 [Staphylothermus marinus F1]|uniref:FtsX-like permease family protein n=1 Tax=Staphylothermus marinus (strain ATCC 43588 / DSM 3639 / JCM 9404 / F1) TaxID=399550 RepID=A3DPC9_STAMF|nr:FtsX-like permease family protein [Staphylothermus marinus]ABN70489.1 protein of unknown function DUF214 [Staphylothermus marinus F1]
MKKTIFIYLFFLIVISLLSSINSTGAYSVSNNSDFLNNPVYGVFNKVLNINLTTTNTSAKLNHYLHLFANIPDRLTGHKGYFEATKTLYNLIKNITYNVVLDNYTVVIPVDEGSYLRIGDRTIKVYPLWPSGGVPVNARCRGKIIVANTINDLNGVDLHGSILLISYSTDWRWLWLLDPHLGVKAILFYEDNIINSQNYDKYLDAPVDLPIGYISTRMLKEEYGLTLSDLNGKTGYLELRSKWIEVNVSNIVAYIPGQNHDYKIMLVTHYDSWSPVVGLAPGATDILAPIYLLMYAEKLVNEIPQYDTIMVWFSGYYEGLEGQRHFVDKYIFNKQELSFGNTSIAIDPAKTLFIGLDLNYRSKYIAPTSIGYFYTAQAVGITRGPINYYAGFISNVFDLNKLEQSVSNKLGRDLGSAVRQLFSYSRDPNTWWTLFPGPYWLDTEPFWSAGLAAFTLKSAFAEKGVRGTPIDYFDKVNLENILLQYSLLDIILDQVYNKDPQQLGHAISTGLSPNAPTRISTSPRNEMFANLIGQVMVWDPKLGQRVSLKKANLSRALVIISAGSRTQTSSPWNLRIVRFTDEEGYFSVEGLPTSRSTGLTITALVLTTNGSVVALNVMGAVSRGSYVSISQPILGSKLAPWEVWIIKFKGNITVNMVVDPLSYQVPIEGGSIGCRIVRMDTMAEPDYYYLGIDETGFFVAYLYKDLNYSLVFGPNPVYYVIENAKVGHKYSLFDALHSTINVDNRRLAKLSSYKVRNPAAEEFVTRGMSALSNATKSLSTYNYTAYRAYILEGLTLAYNAYQLTKSAYLDVENTATLFSVLLVLFAFIMGLYFRKPGASPFNVIGKTLVATAIPGVIFYFIHPALHLTANAIMTIIGFVMIILVIPALLVLLGDFNKALREIRRKIVGVHEVERSKLVAGYMSFSYGVEYMKKRRLRTLLTIITLIVVVISVVLFTSMTSYVAPKPVALTGFEPTRPQGFLLQRETIDRNLPMGSQLYDLVKVIIGRNAVVRYWAVGSTYLFLYDDPSKYYPINSITAVEPTEDTISNISKIIVKGRWFNSSDQFVAIIPATAISDTNGVIDVNKTIVIAGVKFRIIGAYDDRKILEIRELDGQTITPVIGFPRARTVRTIFIPARIAETNPWLNKGLNFYLAQISIKTRNDPYILGKDIVFILPSTDTYAYSPIHGVAKYSKMIALSGAGFNYVVAPIIIASVSILGVLLGSIYERRREIFIYAALGLSPSQIGLMFIAEALAYALIATVIGYVTGILITTTAATFLPGVFRPNYSSGYVVLAIAATFISVLTATIYPVFKASKMALPSLRRKWEFPTKPKGDEWIIPMPFKITSYRELVGSLYYVYEYISGFTSPDIGNFVVEKISISKTTMNSKNVVILGGIVRLKPWHAGVKQEFQIRALEVNPNEWEISIYLKRLSGNTRLWIRSNKFFIDALRKQLLLWRTITPDEKKQYIEKAESVIKA